MSEFAVMPLSDYKSACDKIREKTETTDSIISRDLSNKVDDVYSAGVEAGKAQGGAGGFSLNGTFILKEPITPEDLIGSDFREYFPADSVYAYFYDIKINDYVYLPIESIVCNDKIYHWYATNSRINYAKELQSGKWGYYWVDETTDEFGAGLYPDIKGRIIVFTKPTVVSEDFYNLFMATTNGAEENYDEGKQEGLVEGIEQGKQAEYDRFWDSFQKNGNLNDYTYAFGGNGWNDETFKPKYNIVPTISADHIFSATHIEDIIGCLKKTGVTFDFSQCRGTSYIMSNSKKTVNFPTVDSTKRSHWNYGFYNNDLLHTIEKVILKSDGSQSFTNFSFGLNPALVEIRFEGVIGKNGLNLQWSTKLSKESITNIINALSDSTSGLSITLSKAAVDKAFETSEGANDGSTSAEWNALIATKTNWTINLA